MRSLICGIRSIVFNLTYYPLILTYSLLVVPVCLMPGKKPVRKAVYGFCKLSLLWARWLMGIKYEIRFRDRLPPEGTPIILAAAHQSNLDPMLAFMLRQDVTALAKKELFQTPLIGQLLKKMGVIRIDRQSGTAHRGMDQVAQQVRREGQFIIVYPQATRVPVGQSKKLKSGAYFMHQESRLPVYPVATNTGLFWTKGFWHRSGTAVFEVCEPLAEGLDKEGFMMALEDQIVHKSEALITEAGYGHLLTP